MSKNSQRQLPLSRDQSGFDLHITLVAIIVVVLLALIGGFVYYRQQHDKKTVTTTSSSNHAPASTSSLAPKTSNSSPKSSTTSGSSASSSTTKSSSSSTSSSGGTGGANLGNSTNPSACTTPQLALSLGQPQGAAGTTYMDLILTNTSTETCTLSGYPSVVLVDAQGNQLGTAAAQNGGTVATVTLAPNQAAKANVGFPNAGFFNPGQCSAASTSIDVTPPNDPSYLEATLSEQNCPGFGVDPLSAN